MPQPRKSDPKMPIFTLIFKLFAWLTSRLQTCLEPGWGIFICLAITYLPAPSLAVPVVTDLARQPLVEVPVALGNDRNELRFFPDAIQFTAGKRYKLVLTNPSNSKHYFTAKDFADGIWSQKVDAGNVEVKGAIHELELKPGATADWVFVPLKSGSYELHCSIAGHAEAGMVGKLAISTH
jgi:uncharacterized cupredoxin-like copper-binding protein